MNILQWNIRKVLRFIVISEHLNGKLKREGFLLHQTGEK